MLPLDVVTQFAKKLPVKDVYFNIRGHMIPFTSQDVLWGLIS